jgi:hypothetical protein
MMSALPPGTGQRPVTGVRVPLPTSAQLRRPSTGLVGAGFVPGRPATGVHSGMGGGGGGGGGRAVRDAAYYAGVVRGKSEALVTELARLRGEGERAAREAASASAAAARAGVLARELRGLEAELADYNLALDKARSGAVRGGRECAGGSVARRPRARAARRAPRARAPAARRRTPRPCSPRARRRSAPTPP